MDPLEEKIRQRVSSDPSWASRAILALYDRQTREEQLEQNSVHRNGRGFTKPDAELLSSFAQWILSDHKLTHNQLIWAYRRLPKYAHQLYLIAKEKEDERRNQEIA